MTRLPTILARRRPGANRRSCGHGEGGQAVLGMVLAIALMMVTAGGALAVDAMAHNPLVQADAAEHYAYRALQAGINSYLNTVNAHPDLVDCSSESTASTCTNTNGGIRYDTWTQVPQTTRSAGNVPEYYLWTNPQLCFSKSKATETGCTPLPTNSRGRFEYLRVKIIGAAGYPGHLAYQSSVVDFAAAQGFLTRVWWSNYESTDKAVVQQDKAPATYCKYNWLTKKTTTYRGTKNAYIGQDGTCGRIVFASGTVVDGPVFSNDSIYVTGYGGGPTFGTPTTPTVSSPVTTADPKCIFVLGKSNDTQTCSSVPQNDVKRYTKVNSHHVAVEAIPTSDSTLLAVAQLNGCAYLGPTTISLYATGKTQYMNVWSPETPVKTGHDQENDSGNTHTCVGTHIPAPTSAHKGNGVIYVATTPNPSSSGCSGNGDNPFDGTIQHKTSPSVPTWATPKNPATIKAQIVKPGTFPGTSSGYVYPDGETAGTDDCAGDAFVRDSDSSNTPPSGTPGIAGNLTIAAQDNVVITGSLEYTDCGATFASDKHSRTCSFNPKSVNDSLGLIATDFVEVNRPGHPSCSSYWGGWGGTTTNIYCTPSPGSLLGHCSATVSDLTAVLCNPGPTIVIDAAVLALKHSFAVNDYGVGGKTGTLNVYGSIDQDWRGAVGLVGGTGYLKHYIWDSRLQYVTIPHYLTPATPSWELASSSVQLSTSCPGWPRPYPTGSTSTASKSLYPASTTKGPTGASGAC